MIVFILMPPINPPFVCTSGLHGFVPWIMWEVVTGVEGIYPVEGYYDTCWIRGLWSSQAKVEGTVLMAA
jgi:hypothetical protein